jgi:hypothetical protein
MKNTNSSLWLAVAIAVVATACAQDTSTPTERAMSPADLRLSADKSGPNDNSDGNANEGAFTYAVIGDFPYGPVKRAELPHLVDQINADPAVERVLHAGDIKAGSASDCSDAYFQDIRTQFDRFDDPLVYTPGDNEWTDCHVAFKNNGLYLPTERLQKVRSLFFPIAGRTIGVHADNVTSQAQVDPANAAYIENVMWVHSKVVFAALNITGSNDDTAPWASTPPVQSPPELPGPVNTWAAQLAQQPAEIASRTQANFAWLDRVFENAHSDSRAVVLLFQADMWDGTLANRPTTISAYDAMVVKIGTLAAKYGKPVLLIEGDSHIFRVDQPYMSNSPLFGLHPNTPIAPNVTRMVMNGSSSPTEYVRLTIDPKAKGVSPFTIVEVPYQP